MTLNEKRRAPEELSREDFDFFQRFIRSRTGIIFAEEKKYLLEGKLGRNLRRWGFTSFSDFRRHIARHPDARDALLQLGDAVSINKTSFFREPTHFQLLSQRILPELSRSRGLDRNFALKAWSAGCATGKEPFSLAMVMQEFAEQQASFEFSVLATDLSTRALDTAQRGIYPACRAEEIPDGLKRKYLLRGKNTASGQVRIAPLIRSRVEFRQLNLMERTYPVSRDMDIIFLRNVLIYFDRPTRRQVLQRLLDHLRPEGILFLGSAENVMGLDLPLTLIAPNVYRKTAAAPPTCRSVLQ